MITLFFIVLCLAVIHFIYDGIILPSIRLHLQNRIFALRDEIRWIKITRPELINEELFKYLQNAINNTINFLPSITLSSFIFIMRTFKKNPELYERAEKITNFIDKNSTSEIKNIVKRVQKIFRYAFLANSFVIFIYTCILSIPLAIVFSLHQRLRDIINIPKSEVTRPIPAFG